MAKNVVPGAKPTLHPRSEIPDATSRGQLIQSLKALGYTAQAANALIKSGLTRQQLADGLIATQRQAPKG